MTTDHRRLKFAYARGARIRLMAPHGGGCIDGLTPLWRSDIEYRIHPSDAHLEYGPLSGALRDDVLDGEPSKLGYAAYKAAESFGLFEGCGLGEVADFYFLFLAEALADEGL